MKPIICRLAAAALTIFFSLSTLGKTGSYVDATVCAGVLYAFWWLGLQSRHGDQAKGAEQLSHHGGYQPVPGPEPSAPPPRKP